MYVLGIDLGTSGVKAVLMHENGTVADVMSAAYAPEFGAGGHVEQDPDVWVNGTFEVIKKMTDAHPKKSAKVAALAVSGQMHSSVFLDKNGGVVRKAILWNDTRTHAQAAEIQEKGVLKYVYNAAFAGFTLPKVLWLKQNEPQNYEKTGKVIMPKDYINYCLTGVIKTDKTDAAGTLAFDVKNGVWSKGLLGAVGVSVDIWPDVVESAGFVGEVTSETAARLGLPNGVKVYGGGADNACAAVGTGVLREGRAAVSVGTSGTVIACLNEIDVSKVTETNGVVHLFNHAPPGSYYAMGCMLAAGECLNWLKRGLFPDLSFDEINALAANVPAGSNGLVFLPYLFGERCPHNNENAKGVFFGINGQTGRGEFARAVMEGVAFGLRDMLNMVSKLTNVNEIILTGGGAKSALWAGIIADVFGRDISRPYGDGSFGGDEAAGTGAAAIAAVGCGMFADFNEYADTAGGGVSGEIISPNESNAGVYNERYGVYKKLYEANSGLF